MLTRQEGNFDLGTREPWQVFEQERSSMTLQLHRAGSQRPLTGTVSAKVLHHRLHILGSPPRVAGPNHSATATGYSPATSGPARFLGASWAGEHQAINKLGDLKQPTQPHM